jgi:hypothetical protein
LPTDFASTLRGYLINVYAVAPYRSQSKPLRTPLMLMHGVGWIMDTQG